MTQLTINAGDTLTSIAARYLGSSSKWREIADINKLNVLSGLNIGSKIEIPDIASVFEQAAPVLSKVRTGLNQATSVVTAASNIPVLSGYAKEALSAIGTINGALNQVTQVLGGGDENARTTYEESGIQLIDWLLQ